MLVFAPAEAEPLFADLVGGNLTLVPQAADPDLGERLSAFVQGQVEAAAVAVVVIGADSPTLPIAHVEQAFTALRQADVVLGPATDGGYYLVGCGRASPAHLPRDRVEPGRRADADNRSPGGSFLAAEPAAAVV